MLMGLEGSGVGVSAGVAIQKQQQNEHKRKLQNNVEKITKEELDEFIIETNLKANKIKTIDKLIATMPDSRAKKTYIKELEDMIYEYKVQLDVLEITVEDFIEQSKGEGEIPLVYYRLLKGLQQK